MAAVVEVGLFCTLRTKRCRRVRSLSLSVTAAMLAMNGGDGGASGFDAWWQMAGRVVTLAGKGGKRLWECRWRWKWM